MDEKYRFPSTSLIDGGKSLHQNGNGFFNGGLSTALNGDRARCQLYNQKLFSQFCSLVVQKQKQSWFSFLPAFLCRNRQFFFPDHLPVLLPVLITHSPDSSRRPIAMGGRSGSGTCSAGRAATPLINDSYWMRLVLWRRSQGWKEEKFKLVLEWTRGACWPV